MPEKMFWWIIMVVIALLIVGVLESQAHETHLSDIGEQTNITIGPCPVLSGYLVTSDQRDCYLIYKQIDLQHGAMHVQDMPLTPAGECLCPTIGGD
jgi:hypothetical protein